MLLPKSIFPITCVLFQLPVDVDSYPSINWCSGTLHPYESMISFWTRFCYLNNTTVLQCIEYIGSRPSHSGKEMRRIAALLNEDLSVVQTVFAPSVTLNHCGRYCLPPLKSNSNSIRYCEECAIHGYHSYLHEADWLSRCPFHGIDLKTSYSAKHSGDITSRQMTALRDLMQSTCKTWPWAGNGGFTIHRQGQLERLGVWARSASSAANRLSQGQIWDSSENGFMGEKSYTQSLGRLCALESVPEVLEPLFVETGEPWNVEIRRFPLETKTELARLKTQLDFSTMFDFYKRLSTRSNMAPAFIALCKAAQDEIKVRHGQCRCRWGMEKIGWSYHWAEVHPDQWPHWGCTCPFDNAVQDLELEWGRADLVLSRRIAEKKLMRFMALSHEMHDAGLICYTADAKVSPEGYLYVYQEVWPCCEWIGNALLADLFNATAEFEIESTLVELNAWLDNIDDGINPAMRGDPAGSVHLCETDEGLSLIKWTQSRSGTGS